MNDSPSDAADASEAHESRDASGLDMADLYREYAPAVYRRILRFYDDEDEAEEVLHEVFLQVVEKQDSFRSDASPMTWLYRVATNHCLNRLRDTRRRRELWREHGESTWSRPSKGASQEARTFLKELWRRLPEELATIGIYYHLDGMTQAEIARITGCSRRTIGNRLDELTERSKQLARETNQAPPALLEKKL